VLHLEFNWQLEADELVLRAAGSKGTFVDIQAVEAHYKRHVIEELGRLI
jgi:hypothetical protein